MKKIAETLKNIKQEIFHNPYRLLGVTCEASVRDITRQSSRLKKYLLAGESPIDNSFQALDDLQRKSEDIENAVHAISTDESRLAHAFFWFWNHNAITDEAALEFLRDNNPEEALAVWNKLVINPSNGEFKEVTRKNISAFHNWSVLKFIFAFNNFDAANSYIIEAIKARLVMLDSPFWSEFSSHVTDKTYQTEQEQVELIFLNTILDIEDMASMADIFKQKFVARSPFLDKYFYAVQDRIRSITKNIENTKASKMHEVPESAQRISVSVKKELKKTKKILSSEQYTQLSDQVAKELLQAAIAYFNYYCNDENNKKAPKNFHLLALDILDLAKHFYFSKSIGERIDSNYKSIQEYEYKEGMLALHALREAHKICIEIEQKNKIISSLLSGQRVVVNGWELRKMLEKFVSTSALAQLAASRNKEALDEADTLFEKLGQYIDTSYWRRYLDNEAWKQFCLASYENLPKNSLERLLALLEYISQHLGHVELFLPQIQQEMSDKMIQTISKAKGSKQLEVWEALLKALRDFTSDFVRRIESQLMENLPDNSPLLAILKKRERNRIIRTWIILGITAFLLGLGACGIHSHIVNVERDEADYEIVKKQNTLDAYENFIGAARTQQYRDAAKAQIASIKRKEEKKKRAAEEKELWENLKREKRYSDYLDKYPNGTFSTEAKEALENQKWGTEKAAWETAQKGNSSKDYQKYMQLYPKGAHSKQALQKEIENKINNYYSRSKGSLPIPTYTSYKRAGSSFTIKNDTSGTLTIYFKGPSVKRIEIKKGARSTVKLLNGTYRVVAVTESGTPYASLMTFKNGYYEADYYIHSYYTYSGNSYNYGRRRY